MIIKRKQSSKDNKIPCQPMKYNECLGLPPIRPRQQLLLSSAWRQGMYIGLMTSPPRRIGTMMMTDRQWVTVEQDDCCEVSSAGDSD